MKERERSRSLNIKKIDEGDFLISLLLYLSMRKIYIRFFFRVGYNQTN